MSNDIQNAIGEQGLPENWPAGKRILFLWYAHRHNDDLNQAWPGIDELKDVTGYRQGTILAYRRELINEGYLEQLTRGHTNQRSTFRVHFPPLNRVLPSAHSEDEAGHPPETERVLPNELEGTPQSVTGYAGEYPKKKKEIEKKERKAHDLARCEFILQPLPVPSRVQVKRHKTFNKLLDELEHKGTSLEAIREHLADFDWNGKENPGGIVVTRLRELLATQSAHDVSPALPWCGLCHEDSRTVDVPWEYEGSDGGRTQQCPRCSKFGAAHRPIRGTKL